MSFPVGAKGNKSPGCRSRSATVVGGPSMWPTGHSSPSLPVTFSGTNGKQRLKEVECRCSPAPRRRTRPPAAGREPRTVGNSWPLGSQTPSHSPSLCCYYFLPGKSSLATWEVRPRAEPAPAPTLPSAVTLVTQSGPPSTGRRATQLCHRLPDSALLLARWQSNSAPQNAMCESERPEPVEVTLLGKGVFASTDPKKRRS